MFFGFEPNGFINLSPAKKCFNSAAALFFKNILHQIMFYGNCTRWFFSQAVFILFFFGNWFIVFEVVCGNYGMLVLVCFFLEGSDIL